MDGQLFGRNSRKLIAVLHKLSQLLAEFHRVFTYFMNDLSNSITEGNLELYADDTMLHFIGIDVDVVVSGLNREGAFCGPVRPFKLGDKILDVVYETRCLGIVIDSQLSWNSHLEHLCKSFGKKVKHLKRFKYLSTSTLEKITSAVLPNYYLLQLSLGH